MDFEDKALPRRALVGGLASLGGLALSGCSEGPPSYGNLLRMADALSYRADRLLLPRHALAREYGHRDITSILAIGTTNPGDTSQPYFDVDHGET